MKKIKGTIITTYELSNIIIEKGLESRKPTSETITLQGWGFEIVLNIDGTYYISDTTGG